MLTWPLTITLGAKGHLDIGEDIMIFMVVLKML